MCKLENGFGVFLTSGLCRDILPIKGTQAENDMEADEGIRACLT